MAPPPPNMVPQGMYPVTMGAQPRPGPYPPSPQASRPQQPQYPTPPMASQSQPAPSEPARIDPANMPLQHIDNMTDQQVEEMLADDSKITEFVKRLGPVEEHILREQAVRQLQQEVDALSARIAGNAELEAVRQELEAKRAEFEGKSAQKGAKEAQLSSEALYEKLDAKAKIADAECDEIASKFLAGDMTAQEFAKAYKDKRFHFHCLSAKKESIFHNM